jgi:hypothetical protein
MKTVEDAIQAVYRLLKPVSAVPVYKYARKASITDPAYYVINSLPVGPGILQKCVINVNAYCNDVEPGSPDIVKLDSMTKTAISVLDEAQNLDDTVFIYFQNQNVFEGEELKSHYSNMRFDVRLINETD